MIPWRAWRLGENTNHPEIPTSSSVEANLFAVLGRGAVIGVFVCLLMAMGTAAQAEIRFYKLMKHGGLKRQIFVRNDDKPGCYNFSAKRKVHRIAVINFAHCSVYAEKDCKDQTELSAYWKKKADRKETQLTIGSRWYLNADENVKIGAWRCVEEPPVVK